MTDSDVEFTRNIRDCLFDTNIERINGAHKDRGLRFGENAE